MIPFEEAPKAEGFHHDCFSNSRNGIGAMPKPETENNFNPSGHGTFSPTYSHISSIQITKDVKLVSIAGQLCWDSNTGKIPPSLAEQCALAFRNVDACLGAAGAQ